MAVRPFGSNGTVQLNGASFARVTEPIIATDGTITDGSDPVGDEHELGGTGDGDSGEDGVIDPDTLTGSGSDPDAPYGRTPTGRARKRPVVGSSAGRSTTSTRAAKGTSTSVDLTRILFSIHTFASVIAKTPELRITEEEAKTLGEAAARVSELYDIPLVDEKTRAWLNLGMAATQVYGTRVAAVVIRNKQAKQRAVNPVVPFQVHG